MIKQQGVDASYAPVLPSHQPDPKRQQNSSTFPQKYQYMYQYRNPYLAYPPLSPWAYEHAYHPYAPLSYPYAPRQSDYIFLHLSPEHYQSKNDKDQIIPSLISEKVQSECIKMEANEEKEKSLSSNFIPQQYKCELNRKSAKKRRQKYTNYYWGMEENRRYMEFLITHPGIFDLSINVKKNLRVNVMMSKKIKSRSPQQCHSHHQKMLKKHGSIEAVISFLLREREREKVVQKTKTNEDQVKVEEDNDQNAAQACI